MVCKKCNKGKHKKCRGGTWCDCQHRVSDPSVGYLLFLVNKYGNYSKTKGGE